jgi:tRNA(fMet)-specific endonuclease VapC
MVCLDTSFLVALIRREEPAERKLEELLSRGERLSTTPITVCELFKGVYRSSRRLLEAERVKGLLGYLEVLSFSVDAYERYGKLVAAEPLHGSPIGDMDAMIAAIALTHSESVLTMNLRHFERVPGLLVDSW